jgi:hypothetical protein
VNFIANLLPEVRMGLASLFAHKLRSLLYDAGIIFGVGAVVAMLSIAAGAQKEMMRSHRPAIRRESASSLMRRKR